MKFKPEDFSVPDDCLCDVLCSDCQRYRITAASDANKRLQEMLAEAPEDYEAMRKKYFETYSKLKSLEKMIEEAPTVYKYADPTAPDGVDTGWFDTPTNPRLSERKAKLVCIEVINDKVRCPKCEHVGKLVQKMGGGICEKCRVVVQANSKSEMRRLKIQMKGEDDI